MGSSRIWEPRLATWFAPGIAGASRGTLYHTDLRLIAGLVMTLIWMKVLRRSRRLRKSLHVTSEGLPILEDALPPAEPPAAEAPQA